MPYVLPRFAAADKTKLAFVLAFGDLSYLELCTVFSERLVRTRRPWSDLAFVELDDKRGGFEKLAGIHKVVTLIAEGTRLSDSMEKLKSFLRDFDGFNFSVSLYSVEAVEREEYEDACSAILQTIREAGFRKANMVRSKNGTEVLGREILSRKILDIVAIRVGSVYWLGVTSFVPDTQQFLLRSNERPVISSEISLSSRLARLLLNLSGITKGQVVLDPFCGAGTILSEALVLGANCIGIDRDRNRVENTKRNLEWLSDSLSRTNQTVSLGVGDATKLENLVSDESVDAVVTEPILLPKIDFAPAPEKARRMIRNSSALYSEALYSLSRVVKKGGRVVIVTPALKTSAGKEVSVLLENLDEIRLRPVQPGRVRFEYPVRISNEKTKWISRLVYAFEKV